MVKVINESTLATELRSRFKTSYSAGGFLQSSATLQTYMYSNGSISLNSFHLSTTVTIRSLAKGHRIPHDCQDGQGLGSDIIYMHIYVYLSPPFMPIWSWGPNFSLTSSTAQPVSRHCLQTQK